MILVMLGTQPQQFGRAIELVIRLAGDEPAIVQHGHTPPPRRHPATMRFASLLACETLRELLEQCDTAVCHGGVGSIYMALAAGRRPIVIPRLQRLGEHVDDHQLQITDRLARDGLVVPWRDGADVTALRAAAGRIPRREPPLALRRAVWAVTPRTAV